MPDRRQQLAADAWGALLRVHAALVPTLDRQLRSRVGVPLTWYDVLLELAAAPGRRLTMTDLAARVVLSRTRVSRVVDELVAAGVVNREPHPADARSAYAVITSQGLTMFRRAAPVYLDGIDRQFASGIEDEELAAITAVLRRVLDRVQGPPRGDGT